MSFIAPEMTKNKRFVAWPLQNQTEAMPFDQSARLTDSFLRRLLMLGVYNDRPVGHTPTVPFAMGKFFDGGFDDFEDIASGQTVGVNGRYISGSSRQPGEPTPVSFLALAFSSHKNRDLLPNGRISHPSLGTAPKAPARYLA